MPYKHKRLTDRTFSAEAMRIATVDVLSGKYSVRKSAQEHEVKKSTLALYANKAKEVGIDNMSFSPHFITCQVFSNELESSLACYLKTCSNMYHGLTPKATRRLAYEFAEKNHLKVPDSWKANKLAGKDWFTGFLSRQSELSIRTPENTSLARISSFNKSTVGAFQAKLEKVLKRYDFTGSDIFNLDETGVTTVQKTQKVVATKGQHQVGKVVSRERGELVTQVGIIGANGTALPPVWVFPRKKFDKHRMLSGIPEEYGATGLVHSSGWMTSDNFLRVLEHFVVHVRCSKERQVILIMDNHESHLSVPAIDYCKENGITILTLPPHTSNKLQPLDRTVFGPFKRCFNQGADNWMLSHPGQTLSIYDLAPICMKAWDRSATPSNIKSGFRCTGIWPFDKTIFTEEDFLCSFVTDRTAPEKQPNNASPPNEFINKNVDGSLQPGTSAQSLPEPQISFENEQKQNFVSPSKIRPYPKAPERKLTRKGPVKRKSIIATDTPERDEIAEKKLMKKRPQIDQKKIEKVKKTLMSDSSSDEEEVVYKDSSSDLDLEQDEDEHENLTKLEANSFVVCKVFGKKSVRHYAAKIEEVVEDGYNVKFLKKQVASNRFRYSEEPPAFVSYEEVILKLPNPLTDRSARYLDMIYFNVALTEYSLS